MGVGWGRVMVDVTVLGKVSVRLCSCVFPVEHAFHASSIYADVVHGAG